MDPGDNEAEIVSAPARTSGGRASSQEAPSRGTRHGAACQHSMAQRGAARHGTARHSMHSIACTAWHAQRSAPLLHVHRDAAGALVQDGKSRAVEEEARHAQPLLLTCGAGRAGREGRVWWVVGGQGKDPPGSACGSGRRGVPLTRPKSLARGRFFKASCQLCVYMGRSRRSDREGFVRL